jgi:hypothetical protein
MNQQYQKLTSVKQTIIPEQYDSPAARLQSRQAGFARPGSQEKHRRIIMGTSGSGPEPAALSSNSAAAAERPVFRI